jgi:hypothetical protein
MSEENLDNIETVVVEDAKPEEAVAPEVVEEPKAKEPKVEEAPKEPENVIAAPEAVEVAGLAPVENGAIGSAKFTKAPKPAPAKVTKLTADDKVAIYSERNVTWQGVGKVYRGINIVSKEASAKWLERDHVRIATPEEVAKEYGL